MGSIKVATSIFLSRVGPRLFVKQINITKKVRHLGTSGRCEKSKLYCIEYMHSNLNDSLLKEINITESITKKGRQVGTALLYSSKLLYLMDVLYLMINDCIRKMILSG